ncbi:uncharacterized protein LOC124901449 isoform X2 [Homo sapiens]|uniref:uncharacterized protein LOC124901449 isoform X2 n=1 Tax=Homo sapiens TaxID=9606 RepID=UPI00001D814C|nr:uncharacterized protein LOC124901449 isoform X2 [Homo sapiens]XP_047300739.1 uncharacterized protein LOC124901449 isoform X2 [Homo sapiens]
MDYLALVQSFCSQHRPDSMQNPLQTPEEVQTRSVPVLMVLHEKGSGQHSVSSVLRSSHPALPWTSHAHGLPLILLRTGDRKILGRRGRFPTKAPTSSLKTHDPK